MITGKKNSAAKSYPNFTFSVDGLESRMMLAGNVVVSLTAGNDLLVRGDAEANDIEISTDLNGNVVVQGLNGTTIELDGNQDSQQTVLLDGANVDDLRIFMRGGDDRVSVDGLNIVGDLTAIMSAGGDQVELSNMQIGGNQRLILAGGDDIVSQTSVEVTGNGLLVGAAGSETITTSGLTVGGNYTVSTAGGDDNLTGDSFDVTGSFRAILGGGMDSLTLNNGIVLPLAAVGPNSFGQFFLSTGGGDDTMDISATDFNENARFVFGGGDDTGSFGSSVNFVAAADFFGGGGDDVLDGTEPTFTETPRFISIDTNFA